MAPGLPENISGSCKSSYEQVLGIIEIHFCCIVLFRQIAKAGSGRGEGYYTFEVPTLVVIFSAAARSSLEQAGALTMPSSAAPGKWPKKLSPTCAS